MACICNKDNPRKRTNCIEDKGGYIINSIGKVVQLNRKNKKKKKKKKKKSWLVGIYYIKNKFNFSNIIKLKILVKKNITYQFDVDSYYTRLSYYTKIDGKSKWTRMSITRTST